MRRLHPHNICVVVMRHEFVLAHDEGTGGVSSFGDGCSSALRVGGDPEYIAPAPGVCTTPSLHGGANCACATGAGHFLFCDVKEFLQGESELHRFRVHSATCYLVGLRSSAAEGEANLDRPRSLAHGYWTCARYGTRPIFSPGSFASASSTVRWPLHGREVYGCLRVCRPPPCCVCAWGILEYVGEPVSLNGAWSTATGIHATLLERNRSATLTSARSCTHELGEQQLLTVKLDGMKFTGAAVKTILLILAQALC